jgi:uncharacterized membrane protein YfcA
MDDIVVVAIAGFLASFVDGSLGMGFGPTSSSILLSSGLSPVSVSATVNIAKVATGVVGGAAHWRFGNVDRRIVTRLALPGVLGALVGTLILTNVDGDRLRPILAALLVVIGARILLRFRRPVAAMRPTDGDHAHDLRGVTAAGAVGGVTNGMIGAWGPVVTPFLLHRGVVPRLVVGSVNTAEIAVAVVAAGSLLTSGRHGLDASTVVAMLVGGVLAAPVAALTVRRVPARLLGVLVAGLLLLTNARELAGWAELGGVRWAVYAAIAVVVGAVAWPVSTAPAAALDVLDGAAVPSDSPAG